MQPQLPAAPASGQALAVLMAQVRRLRPAAPAPALAAAAADPRLAADAAAAFLDSQVRKEGRVWEGREKVMSCLVSCWHEWVALCVTCWGLRRRVGGEEYHIFCAQF